MKKKSKNISLPSVEKWFDKIATAEEYYHKYHETVRKTREAYKGKSRFESGERYNIFWSTIETLKPFLYFKQPRPYIQRKSKLGNDVEMLACRMLEKALEWNLEQFDFDSIIKYARNDFLISGMGLVWEQYKPQFGMITNSESQNGDLLVKTGEKVETVYVDPENFIADCDKSGIWENVEWIAKKIFMSRKDAIETFAIQDSLFEESFEDDGNKELCIYEVWDKPSKSVYWLTKELPSSFLKVINNPLNLNGFFPCPKPILATTTNDSIIPEPDFCMIKGMIDELDGITSRMKLTMQALKVSGAYDKSFPELHSILDKDVTLVAVSDFQKLKDNGGIRGIIDFAPIEQYIAALEALARRRDDIVQNIFEVTGVSDIMRGNSDANETATAVTKKTNFGTLRNQDRQNDMQRFICELYRIKAEIICEQFSAETLQSFLSADESCDGFKVMQAVHLLKTEKMRGMALGIETDTVFNQEMENEKLLQGIKVINEMVTSAFEKVSSQPALLPLYRQMIEALAASMPKARQFEAILDEVFQKISDDFAQPRVAIPQINPQVQLAQQQINNDYEIAKEKNLLKAKELEIKAAGVK